MSETHFLQMIERPLNCDGCCSCCLDMGHPPFLIDMVVGIPQPLDSQADSQADYQRLLAAPAEAQSAYAHHRAALAGPCAWLDVQSGRCRHYEFRPDICRNLEVGGKWCRDHRERWSRATAGG